MAVSEIVSAIAATLRDVDGIDQAPDVPPAILGDNVMALTYPQPGDSTPQNHSGRGGRPVVGNADTIVVEVHRKLQNDQIAEGIGWLATMFDAVRAAIWREYADTKFDRTVTSLSAIRTETYGNLSWGSDETFGFRLTLDVTHHVEM